MFFVRAIVILILTASIFGGAAYFAYELYWKPQKLDEQDRQTKVLQPETFTPPDYTLPQFENAVKLQKSGDLDGARKAYEDFIRDYPQSPNFARARQLLGDLNSSRFFTPVESADVVAYTVGSRDSLARIATKFKTSAELIYRVNNLETINLQIGQRLFIPQPDISIDIDHKAKTVTVSNKGEFFKEYPALSVKAPRGPTGSATLKVVDKIALQDNKRVAFGEKNYAGSDRWLMLSGGVAIRGVPDGTAEPFPMGIIVSAEDMDEIFLLAARGSSVTIH